MDEEEPPSFPVGVDPGRRNLITAVDRDGRMLRYTSRQRTFESKLARHRDILGGGRELTRRNWSY